MTDNQTHIIHKQVLDINIQQESYASVVQENISRLCEERLPGMLDSVFSSLELKGSHLIIPKLEIDLKEISFENFNEVFLEQLEKNLYTQLHQKLNNIQLKRDFYEDYNTPEEDHLINLGQQVLFVFINFLQTGSTNQPELLSNITEFELQISEILNSDEFEEISFRLYWNKLFKHNSHSILRLASQFSGSFLKELAHLIWELPIQNWDQLWKEFKKINLLDTNNNPTTQQQIEFFRIVFIELSQYSKSANYTDLLTSCINSWKKSVSKPHNKSKEHWKNNNTGDSSTANNNTALNVEQVIQNNTENTLNENFDEPLSKQSDIPEDVHQNKQLEKLFINNAGLIIAAPFFQKLFKELKYTSDNVFISSELQERAIHLSQYLVTGEERSPENFLALNKLLCGWPINKTIIRDIELAPKEIEECNTLLTSIISNWEKLGNSSISALRETFLVRDGILQNPNGNKNWRLQVERKDGIDILMEYLPWTISIIKLPWMTKSLFTEWT